MTELFQNKYRTKSTRLPSWDYSDDGHYFITINIKNHRCLFGKIENDEMILNKLGKIAVKYWLEIPKHFNNTILDEFIVMPNHIHGIIEIKNNDDNDNVKRGKHVMRNDNINRGKHVIRNYNANRGKHVETQQCCVSTNDANNTNDNKSNTFYKLKPGSISVIIRSYKSIVTKTINKQFPNVNFQWQPKFYDHIIRNEESLFNVGNYIISNPGMWDRDRNNPQNFK